MTSSTHKQHPQVCKRTRSSRRCAASRSPCLWKRKHKERHGGGQLDGASNSVPPGHAAPACGCPATLPADCQRKGAVAFSKLTNQVARISPTPCRTRQAGSGGARSGAVGAASADAGSSGSGGGGGTLRRCGPRATQRLWQPPALRGSKERRGKHRRAAEPNPSAAARTGGPRMQTVGGRAEEYISSSASLVATEKARAGCRSRPRWCRACSTRVALERSAMVPQSRKKVRPCTHRAGIMMAAPLWRATCCDTAPLNGRPLSAGCYVIHSRR